MSHIALNIVRHFLGQLARLDAPLARRLGHFQAMLVGAGLEADVAALRAAGSGR